jgi:hypothetical protein
MTQERKSLDEMLRQEAEDPELERLRAQLYESEQKVREYSERDAEYAALENALKNTRAELAKYTETKKPKKAEGKKPKQQKKAQPQDKTLDDEVKKYVEVGKTFQYVSSVATGVAAGIGGFLAADYLTGSHVTETLNTAAYIGIALIGAANGVCGEILGNGIAHFKYKSSSLWKKINKIVIMDFPIGAAAGGAFSAIGEAIDDRGLSYLGGLLAPIPVGYLVGYLTRARKQNKSK